TTAPPATQILERFLTFFHPQPRQTLARSCQPPALPAPRLSGLRCGTPTQSLGQMLGGTFPPRQDLRGSVAPWLRGSRRGCPAPIRPARLPGLPGFSGFSRPARARRAPEPDQRQNGGKNPSPPRRMIQPDSGVRPPTPDLRGFVAPWLPSSSDRPRPPRSAGG